MRGTKLLALVLLVVLAFGTAGCGVLSGDDDGDSGDGGATSGNVMVTLSWNDPIDMDLEIWDGDGQEMLFRAAEFSGPDSMDGEADEYFEFTQYGDEDYGMGKYVVSVYYADQPNDTDIPSASVTVTVEKPDGSTESMTGTIDYEIGRDQWHALQVDAATGTIERIDEIVEVDIRE